MSSVANQTIENAVERIRTLNERAVELAREGGEESVKAYERLLENVAEAQEAAGDRGADWIRAFAAAQASFTRELASAFPSLLERVGTAARDVADGAVTQLRRVPGLAGAEGEAKGAVSREQDLPITGYDDLRVDEVVARLDGLSTVDLGRVDAYERRTKNRRTVLDRIEALRS